MYSIRRVLSLCAAGITLRENIYPPLSLGVSPIEAGSDARKADHGGNSCLTYVSMFCKRLRYVCTVYLSVLLVFCIYIRDIRVPCGGMMKECRAKK